MSSSPTFLFGTGFLGFHFASEPEASSLLTTLLDLNIKRLDSARKYPPTNPGAAEILLGKAGAVDKGFVIDTKISVTAPGVGVEQFAEVGSKGSLTREAIGLSVKESLEALSVDKVGVLLRYLRTRATKKASEPTCRFFDGYWKGKVKRDFHAEEGCYRCICCSVIFRMKRPLLKRPQELSMISSFRESLNW